MLITISQNFKSCFQILLSDQDFLDKTTSIIIDDREKKQILTFKKLEQVNV